MAGADHDLCILMIPPFFDEMNRMRRTLVDVMRHLDDRGVSSLLPDLPGTNESLYPPEQADFAAWRQALANCAAELRNATHIASFRGGCLIDEFAEKDFHWRFSPAKGNALLRTMMRARIAADKEAGLTSSMAEINEVAISKPVLLAGNKIGPTLFADLQDAKLTIPDNLRTARLESDSQAADVKLAGSPLWLRAEPGDDVALSTAIADDLADWAKQ